ncbi:ATP-NAD kinase family protein [Actinomadura verrucosospora]|uniref:ATP-NAD/AcoX kinase n=1 Tax=Actinomadura verrucosospora TaxID=46165 RepID=A0A7D3ZKN6_ACTVE|nr:NAD(+)/NADH kinase [Actinomadura verrucosospora]QKG22341.1 ATP-NAD/AcoX kinase [Actinomadura verrucosospora]
MRFGLVVNPVAGLGGRAGLKGSDGADVQARARALGAVPRAGERAALALAELRSRLGPAVEVRTADGTMGADAVRAAGLVPVVVCLPGDPTTGADTRAAAAALASQVDLLLFAGGDGTARDVLDAVGDTVPVLGVPTGVKMHSAVFAVHPRAAGEVAALFAAGAGTRPAEVMDLDEDAVREGRVSARLYGHMAVPDVPVRVQQRKMGGSITSPSSVAGIAAELAGRAGPSELLVLGPGGTMRAVAAALGADVPVMGVNVLRDGRPVAVDVASGPLERLVRSAPAWLAVTPIGGQGFLLGRGNQQISPDVVRAVGRDRLAVVATEAKLAGLGGRPLLVDTGDEELDAGLRGHVPVLTGHGRVAMYPVH